MLAGSLDVESSSGSEAAKPGTDVGRRVPAALLTAVSGPPFAGGALWLTLLLDAAMYSVLLYRDYKEQEWSMTVGHYISWYAISDLVALWVPAERRLWWHPFRLHAAVTLMSLEGTLAFIELEPLDAWLCLRLSLCACRLAHAAYSAWRHGPRWSQAAAFPAYARFYLDTRGGGGVSSVPMVKAVFAVAGALVPHLFYMTHYNYGEDGIDAPLTAFQSTFAIQMYSKVLVFELMIVEPLYAGCSELLTSLLFLVQWPLMFDMFWKAPLPLVHIAAEAVMLISAFTAISVALRHKGSGAQSVGAAPVAGGE